MNADVVQDQTTEGSPRLTARVTGVFYLLTLLTGIFAQGFISNRLVVMDNAAATATNILTHNSLYQLGFTVYMVEMACNVTMIVLFYRLLKPAGPNLSLLAAALGITGSVVKTFSRVFYITPLFLLEGASHTSVFSSAQLQEQALLLLRLNNQGAGMALAFAGFYAAPTGWLILKSTFLPGLLGAISIVAGLGWLTFLSPTLGFRLFPYLAGFGFLGALALILWLLVIGVNEQRWREQARLASASI